MFGTLNWTGVVRSSISWNNGGGNFVGLAAGRLLDSNGDAALAGIDGNINADPLFEDPSPGAGDLVLQAGSPSLDAAPLLISPPTVEDAEDRSRAVDGDMDGVTLPDMGAYERAVFAFSVGGVPQTGTPLTFTVTGPLLNPAFVIAGFLPNFQFFDEYGYLTIGNEASVVLVALTHSGLAVPALVPLVPTLEGFSMNVQGLGFFGFNTTLGNFTNRHNLLFFN